MAEGFEGFEEGLHLLCLRAVETAGQRGGGDRTGFGGQEALDGLDALGQCLGPRLADGFGDVLGLKGAPGLAGQVGFFNLFVVKFDYQKEVLEIKEKS